MQIIIDISNFLNKFYKDYDFDRVDYLNSFPNNANFSYSIEINIQKITNDYTNNYLKIFLEDKYNQYRLILSKETKYRIDLLRHDSILRAIENSKIIRSDKNFDIINIISKIRFIKSQLDKINIGFLDRETEKYWIREPVTLSLTRS